MRKLTMRKLTTRKLTTINHISSQSQPLDCQVVGRSHKHESAEKQVSGEALFVDDYATSANCLHAAVILSDIAKGSIQHIDLSEVTRSSGVIKVLSSDDIPGEKDIGPIFKGDPLLADGEIKYHRQPIAVVLARTHHLAWQAAKKAQIEYCSQQATTDFEPASQQPHLLPSRQFAVKAEGTPLPASERSISELSIEGDLHVGGQEHFYLEGQISLAEPTEDGGIYVRSSSQHPTEVQTLVAEVLAIPFNKVTVDMRRMGGGFGGKESQAAQWPALLL